MDNNIADNTAEVKQNQDVTQPVEQKVQEAQVKADETKTDEDPNWRAFREARKKDRAEKEAAEKRASEKEAEAQALKAAMEAAFAQAPPQQQYQQQYPEQNEDSESDRIEKMVEAKFAARDAQYQQQRAQREAQEYPQRLKQTYSDFDQVISQENLDYLDYHYPEVSNPLQRLQEGFDKWSDIYKAVKKFVPNQANARKDAAKAQQNLQKPKSMSSPGLPNVEQQQGANFLSKERKQDNWARMQRTMKQVNN